MCKTYLSHSCKHDLKIFKICVYESQMVIFITNIIYVNMIFVDNTKYDIAGYNNKTNMTTIVMIMIVRMIIMTK